MSKMLQKKKTIILTSVIILLPMLVGVFLWGRLPQVMPTHWGFSNEPNGWSSKPVVVFGMPLFMLALHLGCVFGTSLDPRHGRAGGALNGLVLWITPVIGIVVASVTYLMALGHPVDVGGVSLALMGLVFIVIGNYLPKCRRNSTIGIKVPWTLSDEETWRRTHRLAGPLWVAAGLVSCVSVVASLRNITVLGVATVVAVLVPIAYSAWYYHRVRKR